MDSLPEFIISIHVPTWGTTIILFVPAFTNVFQFTFPRGERLHGWEKAVCTKYFNSRSHVGNDKKAKGEKLDKWISIHVPTWGTTNAQLHIRYAVQFQFTFPRGERPFGALSTPTCSPNFNSRSHVGNDSKFSQIFFAFLCNKYNFSTFYYPFPLFFGVIRFTFLIFVVRILPVFYVYF